MKTLESLAAAMCMFLALTTAAIAQDATETQTTASEDSEATPQLSLESLVGSWEGTCRTWLRPDELADESQVKGEFQSILGGRLLRHSYVGTFQGQPRIGVVGRYSVGPETPQWSWKTVFALTDVDHLTIIASNVLPDGREAKAVETEYTRIKP